MRRREFVTLLGVAAAYPLAARAQQADPMRRIGVLMSIVDDPEGRSRLAALQQGLQELQWTGGRNLNIDVRWSGADVKRSHSYATELVGLNPDLHIAHAPLALTSLQQKTRSIPIVFLQVPDPVEAGFVASIARPGANITGFTHFDGTMGGKWLSLLKEIAPHVSRALSIHFPDVGTSRYFDAMKVAAPSLGMQLAAAEVRSATDIESALEAFAREPHGGIIAPPSNITYVHRRLVFALAARHRLPAVYAYRFFATNGGLMSYGVDLVDLFRRAASYVDRILKGAKPADLPVQAPTKFQLIINLKTAKALGLDVPATLLARADEVIE
jgi:putative tryptophan/tyrosine transport system substrate-binding protein